MPNVKVDNQFSGNWKDYKMFSLTAPSDGRTYITGYRKSDGKQLRRYEYQRDIMTDEEIPNSIDEINKIVSYKANPREWMKLYMRARRKLDYDGGGTRDNPKPAFPDSNFQREGARKRGPGKARDKEEDKKKLIKMRRRIKEGKIKEDKEREALKRKYEEQYKINKIYDSYLDMLADKSEEELKEFEEKQDIKRTKKQQQNFVAAYRAAERKAKERERMRQLAKEREEREKKEREDEKARQEELKLNKEVVERSKKLSKEIERLSFGDLDDFEDFDIIETSKEKLNKRLKKLKAKEQKAEDDIDLMEIDEERQNIEEKHLSKIIPPLRRQLKTLNKRIDEANKALDNLNELEKKYKDSKFLPKKSIKDEFLKNLKDLKEQKSEKEEELLSSENALDTIRKERRPD